MSNTQNINPKQTLAVNGEAVPLAEFNQDTFLQSNKKTTTDYRAAFAQAIGTTGQIAKIVKMAFGIAGETDDQGNPAPPSDNGNLNNVVLTKDITKCERKAPKFIYGDISSLKNNDSISLFFIVLYF